jgi:PAS domain-containing protein
MGKYINPDGYDGNASFFFFLTFLRHKIDHDGAKQIKIARAIAVRPEYINRVYKGRQTCSVDVQEKICRFFAISYLDALAIGRHLVESGELPADRNTQPDDPPASGAQNRRMADRVSGADVVSIVSQLVAKKKETEDSLAKLQNILENLSDGLVILDPNLLIEYQNRAHREMFGVSLVGRDCSTFHDCARFAKSCPCLLSRRNGMPAEGILPCAQGTVSALTTPIRDISGQITGYVQVLRDSTSREKVLMMAKESLEMIGSAVFAYNDNQQIVLYNSKIKEITGAGDDDLVTTETFLNFVQKNRIYTNFEEVAEAVEKARKDRKEISMKIYFSNGATYLYTAKSMYTGNRYSGRIGVFTPSA